MPGNLKHLDIFILKYSKKKRNIYLLACMQVIVNVAAVYHL